MPESSDATPKITRRDFLTFWKWQLSSENTVNQNPEPPIGQQIEPQHSLTKRQFLKLILVAGGGLVAEHYLGIKPAEANGNNQSAIQKDGTLPQADTIKKQQKMTVSPPKSPSAEEEPTLFNTEVETALLTMAELVSASIIKALKIPVGNAAMDQEKLRKTLDKPLYKTILIKGVSVPILEEAFFRGLPNLIIKGQPKKDLWQIGVPVSAIYALCHNLITDENTGNPVFATNKIPLYQFINGLFFWKMMRERGFPHAVAAHVTINSIALTIGELLNKAFPVKSSAGVSKDVVGREK